MFPAIPDSPADMSPLCASPVLWSVRGNARAGVVQTVSRRQAEIAAKMVAYRKSRQSVARKAQPGDYVVIGKPNRAYGRAGGAAKVAMRKFVGTQEATVLSVEAGGKLRVRLLSTASGDGCGDTIVVPPDLVLKVLDRARVDLMGGPPDFGVDGAPSPPKEPAPDAVVTGGGSVHLSHLGVASVASSFERAWGGRGTSSAAAGITRVRPREPEVYVGEGVVDASEGRSLTSVGFIVPGLPTMPPAKRLRAAPVTPMEVALAGGGGGRGARGCAGGGGSGGGSGSGSGYSGDASGSRYSPDDDDSDSDFE